jgi:hypothetical protein
MMLHRMIYFKSSAVRLVSVCDVQWREHGAHAADRGKARNGIMAASAELLEEAQLRFKDAADPATPLQLDGSGRRPADRATPGSDASAQTAGLSPDTSSSQQQQLLQQQTRTAQHADAVASRTPVSDTPQQTSGLSAGSAAKAPLDLHSWAQATGTSTNRSGFSGHRPSVGSGGKENLWLTPVLGSQPRSASPVRSASPGMRRSHLLPAFDNVQRHTQRQHNVSVTSQQAAHSTTPAMHGQPSTSIEAASRTAGNAQPAASPVVTSLQPGEHRTEVWLHMQSTSPSKQRHHHQHQQQQREASAKQHSADASDVISTMAAQPQQSSHAASAAADSRPFSGAAPAGTVADSGQQSHSSASVGVQGGSSAYAAVADRASTAAAAAAVERCRAEVQADAERLAALETRLMAQQEEFPTQKAAADAVLLREKVRGSSPLEGLHHKDQVPLNPSFDWIPPTADVLLYCGLEPGCKAARGRAARAGGQGDRSVGRQRHQQASGARLEALPILPHISRKLHSASARISK